MFNHFQPYYVLMKNTCTILQPAFRQLTLCLLYLVVTFSENAQETTRAVLRRLAGKMSPPQSKALALRVLKALENICLKLVRCEMLAAGCERKAEPLSRHVSIKGTVEERMRSSQAVR